MENNEDKKDANSLFRQQALEHLSTPHPLDDMIQVTSPLSWILLVTVWIILVAIIIWTIFGNIQIHVSGPGILLSENEKIVSVYAPEQNAYVKKTLVNIGNVVKENQIVAELNIPEIENEIIVTKNYIKTLQDQYAKLAITTKTDKSWQETLFALNLKIIELQNKLQDLTGQLQTFSQIKSPISGIVTSIQIKTGDFLEKGRAALQIATRQQNLEAWVYLPAEEGKRITNGMRALVNPSTVRALEFGSIMGKVIAVDNLPTTPESMQDTLNNKSLVDHFLKAGPVIMVRVKLLANPHNRSGLQWTSSEGPPYSMTLGTLVQVEIITSEQSPLSLIIPSLKTSGY